MTCPGAISPRNKKPKCLKTQVLRSVTYFNCIRTGNAVTPNRNWANVNVQRDEWFLPFLPTSVAVASNPRGIRAILLPDKAVQAENHGHTSIQAVFAALKAGRQL
jgi:hypothetical protein